MKRNHTIAKALLPLLLKRRSSPLSEGKFPSQETVSGVALHVSLQVKHNCAVKWLENPDIWIIPRTLSFISYSYTESVMWFFQDPIVLSVKWGSSGLPCGCHRVAGRTKRSSTRIRTWKDPSSNARCEIVYTWAEVNK